jgi:hypothetical protein
MYAGDWIFGLLGTTMWVGGILSLGGAGAILIALLHAAMGAGGLARTRSFPPTGVINHAEEVRARMRSRYMARAWRSSETLTRPAFAFPAAQDEADPVKPSHVPEPDFEPIAVLIAQGGEMSITRLPPINESLRRRLATRVAEPQARAATRPPRKARRKAKRSRKPVAA